MALSLANLDAAAGSHGSTCDRRRTLQVVSVTSCVAASSHQSYKRWMRSLGDDPDAQRGTEVDLGSGRATWETAERSYRASAVMLGERRIMLVNSMAATDPDAITVF